jgi:hypothetical protein
VRVARATTRARAVIFERLASAPMFAQRVTTRRRTIDGGSSARDARSPSTTVTTDTIAPVI